jgi:serine/threonine protein kinase
MPYISKGAYGCAFFPHLKCTTGEEKKDAMGKIFSDNGALTEEQKISEIIQKLDPSNEFTIPFYESCTTDLSQADENDMIEKCSHTNALVDEGNTKTRQLLYHFGGVDLEDIVQHFASYQKTHIDDFIHLLLPIIEGIIILQKHEYIHCDIKPSNILYDDKKGKLYLIDFGLLTKFKELPLNTGVTWFTYPYYPPEFKVYHHLVDMKDTPLNIIRTIVNNFVAYDEVKFEAFLKQYCGISATFTDVSTKLIQNASKNLEQFKTDFTTQFVKKVDTYSLGITFLEMCFVLEKSKIMRVRNRELFGAFMTTIIPRMIDFDPYKRADPQTILDAIKNLLRSHKIPTSPSLQMSPIIVEKIATPNIPSPKSVNVSEDCMKLKRVQIVELLKAHGLHISGNKKTLCERLQTFSSTKLTKEQCIKLKDAHIKKRLASVVKKKCYKLRKKECLEGSTCTWVVGKGCKQNKTSDVVSNNDKEIKAPNVFSNKDIASLIKTNLGFADKAAMLMAKNSKSSTLQVIKISTNKESIPSYFRPYINLIPIAYNTLHLARNVVIVVGSYHHKKFLIIEFKLKNSTHFFSVFDSICISSKNITFVQDYSSPTSSSNLDMHKDLLKVFHIKLQDDLKQQSITSYQPRTFQKKSLDVLPLVKNNKYVFDIDGVTLTLKPSIRSVAIDPKTEAVVRVEGFKFDYVVKVDKPKISIQYDAITFKDKPQDVTLYWSKAYNAATTYLNNLKHEDRKTIVLNGIKGTVKLTKKRTSSLDTEAIWNDANPGLPERPIFVVASDK